MIEALVSPTFEMRKSDIFGIVFLVIFNLCGNTEGMCLINTNHYSSNRYKKQTENFFQGQSSSCSFIEWKCDNGQCITVPKLCNGVADCADGSDETVKECIATRCPDTKFRCAYGGCVKKDAECNGSKDCADNSDELTAKCDANYEVRLRGSCAQDEYQCKTGQCIAANSFCDGFAHCPDQSDETVESCATSCCTPAGFRCGYGACVDDKVKCNGIADCIDGSDENALVCGRTIPSPPRRTDPPAGDNFVFPTRRPTLITSPSGSGQATSRPSVEAEGEPGKQ